MSLANPDHQRNSITSMGAFMTRFAAWVRRRTWTLGAAALTTTGLSGCASVSPQQEVQMGQQYAAEINKQLPIVRDPEINRYINVLGDSLARTTSRADLDWQFYIVDSPEVNAFAVPGGFIYINRGLIERATTMSEVAGVLGHEIGHVVRRHSVKQMEQQQNANIGLTVGCILAPNVCGNQAAAAGIQLGAGAVFARFSRADEQQADEEGVRNTTRAGIDPRGIPSMFRILLNERQARPDAVSGWFSTHPLEESRIDATQAQIQREVPAAVLASLTRDSRNFQAFKSRLASLPRTPQQRQSAR
jgi:predicted Zn-dependent protease